MKTSTFTFIAFLVLIIAVSCSSPSDNTEVLDKEKVESARGDAASATEEMDLLFARKWESEELYLDLKLDGTFEGSLATANNLFGVWSISEDQKTLVLNSDQHEGKGHGFHFKFSIVDINPNQLKIQDSADQEMIFLSV
jgi:hypothetical protein